MIHISSVTDEDLTQCPRWKCAFELPHVKPDSFSLWRALKTSRLVQDVEAQMLLSFHVVLLFSLSGLSERGKGRALITGRLRREEVETVKVLSLFYFLGKNFCSYPVLGLSHHKPRR